MKKSLHHMAVLSALCIIGLSACAGETSECRCKQGEMCINGLCIPDENPCDQCKDSEVCVDGKCIPKENPCDQCRDNEVCVDGKCIPKGDPCDKCKDDEICINGTCIPKSSPCDQCRDNEVCVDGKCIPKGNPCDQCRDNEVCVDGKCVKKENPCDKCKDDEKCIGDKCVKIEDLCAKCTNAEVCIDGLCIPKDDPCAKCTSAQICFGKKCIDRSPEPLAPSYIGLSAEKLAMHMGAALTDGGIQFVLFSKNAARIELLLFENPDDDMPAARIPLTRRAGSDLWTVFIRNVGAGTHYGYIAWGPNWPYDPDFRPGTDIGYIADCDRDGNRFNPNKLLIDPYTRRLHGEFDWTKGSPASGAKRRNSTWGAAAKSVVISSGYQWSTGESKWRTDRQNNASGHGYRDAVYYEVHPKGFTAGDKTVSAPGTWRGIGEKAPYLKELGITALELMPVTEKNDGETYWGYSPIAFFAPEQQFASDDDGMAAVTDEFKWMVDQLHQNGIEVVLDVVFNHTGEGGIWKSDTDTAPGDKNVAASYAWRGLDNASYYYLAGEGENLNQLYYDGTGVGTQIRTDTPHVRRFIFDNLYYWIEEMHVDGFRFDLASLMGVPDGKPGMSTEEWFAQKSKGLLQDIIDDPVLKKHNTRIIAEPWDMKVFAVGGFPKSKLDSAYAWSEWNGRFRDAVRKFVNYQGTTLSHAEGIPPKWEPKLNIGNLLTGSGELFADDGRRPYHAVNYLTSHDGFTLYDLVSYSVKLNGCSRLNPACCDTAHPEACDSRSGSDDNNSKNWCALEEQTDQNSLTGHISRQSGQCADSYREDLKRQIIRNYFALLILSQGSPMILGGDEYMRSQYGNNNAYSKDADNEYNWFRWEEWLKSPEKIRMHDFVRKLIALRRQYAEFLAPESYDFTNLTWLGPDDNPKDFWSGKSLAMLYKSKSSGRSLFIAVNMDEKFSKTFTLPPGTWQIVGDTQSYFESDGFFAENKLDPQKSCNISCKNFGTLEGSYTTKPLTIVILEK